jgi:hypothetical protein
VGYLSRVAGRKFLSSIYLFSIHYVLLDRTRYLFRTIC